eukprot:m.26330 g.26330  ORF g.26330 m.26330 type:complete len:64 (-) comp6292_c0_seq2:2424-2615(-)
MHELRVSPGLASQTTRGTQRCCTASVRAAILLTAKLDVRQFSQHHLDLERLSTSNQSIYPVCV